MSEVVRNMFSQIAPRYDLANDVLSFGLHRIWRKQAVKLSQIHYAKQVLDICTGTGDLAYDISRQMNLGSKIIGLDFSSVMLHEAKKKYHTVPFLQGDALKLPFANRSFEGISVAFGIRNMDNPQAGLQEMKRVLKPGGILLILEFGNPTWFGFRQLYRWYGNNIMPLIGGLLTGNRAAYEYLPRTSRAFPAGKDFVNLLLQSGFGQIQAKPLLSGLAYIYCARLASISDQENKAQENIEREQKRVFA